MVVVLLAATAVQADDGEETVQHVAIETDRGTIELELNAEKAPVTVENFMGYVRDGFYQDTVFHRVIPGFMIQGGGMTVDMERKTTREPIVNESDNGLSNARGTIAMARTQQPHSATSQFFINVADNTQLDGRQGQPGYAVFGRVTAGMDVVDTIVGVETTTHGQHRDVPAEPIRILSVTVIDGS